MATSQRAQIVMTEAEIAEFLDRSRTMTVATVGPGGVPHLVAMWYAVVEGDIWIETKAKSQKVANIRRDKRVTCLVEDGDSYDVLRGVSIEGDAVIVTDPDQLHRLGVAVYERYQGPYTEELRPAVAAMMNKRVGVRIRAIRTRSWDHRKLGLPSLPVAGSTAEYLA
jgi:PPOX class probable F420-dependent enzyme